MEVHIFSLIMDIFFVFTLHIVYARLLGERWKKKIYYIGGWAMCLLLWNGCSYMFAEYPLINSFCGTVVNFFVLFLLYQGRIREKVIIIFLVVVLGFIAEILAVFIMSYTNLSIRTSGNIRSDGWYIGNAISKIIWFICVKIITCFSHNKRKQIRICWTEWLDIFLVPISSLIILYIVVKDEFHEVSLSVLIVYGILLIINVLNYLVYQKMQMHAEEMLDKQFLKQQNDYYRIRFEDAEKQWKVLRKMRHDMGNNYVLHLSYLENKEYDKLEEIYRELIGNFRGEHNYIETGNIGIDAISNYKVEVLKGMNVQIKKEIKVIDEINIDNGDVNTLFGSFFDNAIEALEKVDETERKIDIKILADKTALLLRMSNTFDGILERDKNMEIITRKKDKVNHGIGIRNVKEIVKKYNGKVEFEIQENVFMAMAFLYTEQ